MKKALTAALITSAIILISTAAVYPRVFATVSGTVQSDDGKPIKGAKVILIFSEDGTKYELTTDEKGRWRKPNIRPGKWTIGFMAEGYEPQNLNVELSSIRKNKPIEIRLAPVPESALNQGDTLYLQKKYAEALNEYQRALKENPDLHISYEKIGLCYYRLSDLEKAIEAFKRMLEKDPQSKDTLTNLSAIYFEKENLEEGMKYFKQLDEESLTDPSLFYNIGILLFKENQIDMAIEFLQKCITIDPNYINGHYQLALANLNKGNMEEAKSHFQKIIELAPDSEKASLAKKMLESLH